MITNLLLLQGSLVQLLMTWGAAPQLLA
jgi:hypothetical protein